MKIRIENADTPLMKNCYIDTEIFSISGFYGLSDIEIQHIVNGDSSRLWLSREEFNELYDMMTEIMRNDEAATEFICSAVRDYLSDLH